MTMMVVRTKAEVRRVANEMGCTTHYDGKNKTFYIKGAKANDTFNRILTELGPGLPFAFDVQ